MKSFTLALSAILAVAQSQELGFTILHINDMHARVQGMVGTGGCSTANEQAGLCDGGWSKMVTAAKEFVDAQDTPVVFIDNGDQFAGTIWSSFYQGEEVYTLKNQFCQEAGFFICLTGIGNHEFDFGYMPLLNYARNLNHQMINSNIIDTCAENANGEHAAAELGGLLNNNVVVDINGTSVGFVGYLTPETPGISSPPGCMEFLDESDALTSELAVLRDQSVDVIVVIGHSGITKDLELSAEFADDIDLIVGGHSHTFLWNTEQQGDLPLNSEGETDTPAGLYPSFAADGGVPVLQAYFGSRYLGAIDLTFVDGELTDFTRRSIVVADSRSEFADSTTSYAPDAEMQELVDEMSAPLQVFAQTPVGSVPITFDDSVDGSRRIRVQEMPLGNVACDAMMASINGNTDGNADMCMQNAGGIRAPIEAGDVTYEDVITVFPFANVVSVLRFTGERVFAAVEHGLARVGTDSGEFLHFGAGFQLFYDPAAAPFSRVINISLNGELVANDTSQTYDVVTNSFIAAGGDNFGEIMTGAEVILELGDPQEDTLAAYIENNENLCQETEGRINPISNPVTGEGVEIDVLGTEFPSCADIGLLRFTILHINDMHARVMGMRGTAGCSNAQNEAAECDGGWARIMSASKRFVEESDHPVIFIDNGDQFAGTSWSTFYKGREVYTFENKICADAGFAYCFSGMGNHEFDFGYEPLLEVARNLNHSILVSNIDDSCEADSQSASHATGELGSFFEKQRVVDISGTNVGFLGYTLQGTPSISSPPPCLSFSEEGAAIQTEIDELEANGVNIIIVTGHSGIDKDLQVANDHPSIDLIVGGHSHTFLWDEDVQGPVPAQSRPAETDGVITGLRTDGSMGLYPTLADDTETPVVQAYFGSRYMGALEVVFNISTGDLVSFERKSVLLANENSAVAGATEFDEATGANADASKAYGEDEEVKALVDELLGPLNVFAQTAVGYTPVTLQQSLVRIQDTPLGNAICDGMVKNMADKGTVVDACIQNGGGIRADINAGIISFEDVITVLPFSNVVTVLEFTPNRLWRAFEFGLLESGGFPQTSAGVSITYDSTQPEGTRIISFTLNGEPVDRNDDTTTLLVVTNNFIANGGDSYGEIMTGAGVFLESGDPQEDTLVTYLGENCPACFDFESRLTDVGIEMFTDFNTCGEGETEGCPVLEFEEEGSASRSAFFLSGVFALLVHA